MDATRLHRAADHLVEVPTNLQLIEVITPRDRRHVNRAAMLCLIAAMAHHVVEVDATVHDSEGCRKHYCILSFSCTTQFAVGETCHGRSKL